MAQEAGRITKNKKITLPGGSTVLVPVIDTISFVDPVDQGQETRYTIDNSLDSNRTVRVDQVNPDGSLTGTGDKLPVERITQWNVADPIDHGQESQYSFDNETYDPNGPPYFTTHKRAHTVRYLNDPDDGNWIESELIDEIAVIDPVNRGQETDHTLENLPGTDDGQGHLIVQAGTDADDITNGTEGVGVDANPVRLDPFQNIVKFGGDYLLQFFFQWTDMVFKNPLLGAGTITIIPSTTTITLDDPPAGATLLWNELQTIPQGAGGNFYQQTIVYKMRSLPSADESSMLPMSFGISITDQDTFTDYVINGPDTDQTFIVGGPLSGLNGPWPSPSLGLYSASKYHFDSTKFVPLGNGQVIYPNNPGDNPGPVASIALGNNLYILTTVANSDIAYGPPPVTSGGVYSIVGLLEGGRLVIDLQMLRSPDHNAKLLPHMWPTEPVIRTVDSVFSNTAPPPPPYFFGVYHTKDDPNGPYKFGGPPLTSNKYTDTVPVYP